MTAKELCQLAFTESRDPRSDAYRVGVLDAAKYWMGETRCFDQPYMLGTAEADAWFSGADEGRRITKNYLAAQNEAQAGKR